MRAGVGALHGTEQLALDEFTRQGGAVDLDDPALAARAEGVQEIGNDFLAGAALAGDQNGHVAGGDAFDGADDLAHGGAVEHWRGAAAHGFEGAPQHAGFLGVAAGFHGVGDVGKQLAGVEPLTRPADEVERAALGGRHRPRYRLGITLRRAGQHDDLGFGPALLERRAAFRGRWRP